MFQKCHRNCKRLSILELTTKNLFHLFFLIEIELKNRTFLNSKDSCSTGYGIIKKHIWQELNLTAQLEYRYRLSLRDHITTELICKRLSTFVFLSTYIYRYIYFYCYRYIVLICFYKYIFILVSYMCVFLSQLYFLAGLAYIGYCMSDWNSLHILLLAFSFLIPMMSKYCVSRIPRWFSTLS